MAVVNIPQKTTLSIQVQKGISDSGNPVYAYRNYANVKPDATVQDIFDVANALANLQVYALANIQRVDYSKLMNQ